MATAAVFLASVAPLVISQDGMGGMGGGASCQVRGIDYNAPGLKTVPCRGTAGTANDNNLIYGSFEAGFSAEQTTRFFGCTNDLVLPAGVDTLNAERMIHAAADQGHCREGVSVMNACGGHATPFHYHERMDCLYNNNDPSGHSSSPGTMLDTKKLYGMWENYTARLFPVLDACNGHFGVTPDSNGEVVYHYHVTEHPPFFAGCFGPAVVEGVETMVTLAMCRAHHSNVCGDGDDIDIVVWDDNLGRNKTISYDPECPCFDRNHSNTGNLPLEFESAEASTQTPPQTSERPTVVATPAPPTTSVPTAPPTPRSNIFLIMPDDLDFLWEEAPPRATRTRLQFNADNVPHINRIRNEGAVFEKAYVAGPKCAPARFNVLTGRYCSRSEYARAHRSSQQGDRTNVEVPPCKIDGGDRARTVAADLQAAGYHTVMAGKWHVMGGTEADQWGNYTALEEHVRSTGFTTPAAVYAGNMNGDLGFSHNMEWMTAETNDAIRSAVRAGNPFYTYFAPTIPHGPNVYNALAQYDDTITPAGTLSTSPVSGFNLTRSQIRALADQTDDNERSAGEIYLDQSVKSVMDNLETLGVLDNTLLVFVMDHGQAAKDTLYEGGTRVVLMARLPGHIAANSQVSTAVTNLDFGPTFLQVAGIQASYAVDGISWWAAAAGTPSNTHTQRRCIVSEIETDRAIVCHSGVLDGMKYINKVSAIAGANGYPFSNDTEQLYDLSNDGTEQVNLVNESGYASRLRMLQEYMECHLRDTAPENSVLCDAELLITAPLSSSATVAGGTVQLTELPSFSRSVSSGSSVATRNTAPFTTESSGVETISNRITSTASFVSVIRLIFPGDLNSLSIMQRQTLKSEAVSTVRSRFPRGALLVLVRAVIFDGSIVVAIIFSPASDTAALEQLTSDLQSNPVSVDLGLPSAAISMGAALSSEVEEGFTDTPTQSSLSFSPSQAPTIAHQADISGQSSEDGNDENTTIIIIVVIALIVLFALVIFAVLYRRRQDQPQRSDRTRSSPATMNPTYGGSSLLQQSATGRSMVMDESGNFMMSTPEAI